MFGLKDKIALITGGSRGIGLEFSRTLARAGARIIIANRNGEQGKKALETLASEGLPGDFHKVDISSVDSIRELFAYVMATYGKLDISVHNAAAIRHMPAEDFTEGDWDFVVDANLRGTFFCCQNAYKCMKGNGGRIINICSHVSVFNVPGRSVYSITKAGITKMTQCLGQEWAADGITVNAIGPGLTLTDLNSARYKEHPEELENAIKRTPMNRVGTVGDYASCLLFLASDASSFMTGQLIVIDGGMSLGLTYQDSFQRQ